MNLLKKCLIEFNNKFTNHITKKEVNDNEQLRFTLLDMQKFAKYYHKKKSSLNVVVSTCCDIDETTLKNKLRLADINYHLKKANS